jgi:hypothetical protein
MEHVKSHGIWFVIVAAGLIGNVYQVVHHVGAS